MELLVCYCEYLSEVECLKLRLVSQRYKIAIALRFRKAITKLSYQSEQLIMNIKKDGLWELIDRHPIIQANKLRSFKEIQEKIIKYFSSSEFSVTMIPIKFLKITVCFLMISTGTKIKFEQEGQIEFEKIQDTLNEVRLRPSLSNLTDTVLDSVKKLLSLTLIEEEEFSKADTISSLLLNFCKGMVKWHEDQEKIYQLKLDYHYNKLEDNRERIKVISRVFIKFLKKDIPPEMF